MIRISLFKNYIIIIDTFYWRTQIHHLMSKQMVTYRKCMHHMIFESGSPIVLQGQVTFPFMSGQGKWVMQFPIVILFYRSGFEDKLNGYHNVLPM